MVRLRDQPGAWHRTLVENWGDYYDSMSPVQFYWVAPMPPSSLTQHTIGHVLVVQGLPVGQVASLITTRVRDEEGQAIHRVATFLPAQVSAEMVVEVLALPGPLRRFPRRVGHGDTFFAPYAAQPISSGDSLVVDIQGSSTVTTSTAASSTDALNLIQTKVQYKAARPSPERVDPHDAAVVSQKVTISLDACLPSHPTYQETHHSFPETLCWHQPDWPQRLGAIAPRFDMLPEGLHLHASTYCALTDPQKFADATFADSSVLYIDGSAHSTAAAWSIVLVTFDNQGIPSLQGCIADVVKVETHDPQWIGADSADNIAAELTAAAAAMIASLGFERSRVIIRPDLTLSAMLATHQWHCSAHPILCRLCQVLGSWFGSCNGSFCEVRGHCGDPWNELADALARHCLTTQLAVGALQVDVFSQLAKSPDLDWAWMLNAPASLHHCLPPGSDEGVWQVQPSLRRVTSPPKAAQGAQWRSLSLFCISANVLALGSVDNELEPSSSSERALRLAHQWGQQKAHVIGLQESRREAGIYQAGPYKCFASGALRCTRALHFGCELWLHQELPLDAEGTLLLKDFQPTITHADPRRLILNLAHVDCRLTFIVLHVPCKTAQCGIDEIESWWQQTIKLIEAASPAACTWAFVDANAPLASHDTEQVGMAGAEAMNPMGVVLEK